MLTKPTQQPVYDHAKLNVNDLNIRGRNVKFTRSTRIVRFGTYSIGMKPQWFSPDSLWFCD